MKSKVTISLRLNEEESEIIRNFAQIKGLSVSEFFRVSAMRHVFNEISALEYEEAKQEYLKSESKITSDSLKRKLGVIQ